MVRKASALGFVVALLVFVGIAAECVHTTHPPAPNPLTLKLVCAKAPVGRGEPLITSGGPERADFLFLRWTSADSARIGYDYWGLGGPSSAPFPLEPGTAHVVSIEMPGLSAVHGNGRETGDRVRVFWDGREVFNATVPWHVRGSRELWIGENPVGGTSSQRRFDGTLASPDGKPLVGRWNPGSESGVRRLRAWMTQDWPSAVVTLVLALLAGAVARALVIAFSRDRPAVLLRRHAVFLIATAGCAAAFVWLISEGPVRLLYPESFGSFYDYQARSILGGHLDVPRAAITDEAFLFGGRCYGYFGVTPALLRIPFVVYDIGFGQLSRIFMLAYYLGSLTAAYALLRRLTALRQGPDAGPSAAATALLIANTGLGSTLLFLGSRTYIYHEAVLASVAFGLWSLYFSLRYLAAPTWRWAGWALLAGAASVNSRPSAGLFALVFLGCASLVQLWRRRHAPGGLVNPLAVGGLCAAAFCTSNFVSYLKFHTLNVLPLQYHVQYIENPPRLANFGAKNFHWSNLGLNLHAYALSSNLRWRAGFPYLVDVAVDPYRFPKARYDIAEPIAGIPYSMTGLTFFAILGLIAAPLLEPRFRAGVLCLVGASVPLCLALLMAVASSERYTGDFVPMLVLAASFGLAATERTRACKVLNVLAIPATVWSVAAMAAIALRYQGEVVWGVAPEGVARYHALERRFDRSPRHEPGP